MPATTSPPTMIAETNRSLTESAVSRLASAAQLFGIDPRALAVFRIGAATLVLADLWYRSHELTAFFTDNGVLPRPARVGLFEFANGFGFEHQWSLHMLSGTWWSQAALMLVAAWFAIWLLIGYRTRLAAIVTWVLLLSLDARNPMILDSGDVLLRCLLFWGLFLPLGASTSVDRRHNDEPATSPILSAATVAMLLQVCMMYLFSIGFKTNEIWTEQGAAVYYALNLDFFTTPLGRFVRQFPMVMTTLTWSSYWLELVGPLLVFSPLLTRWLRPSIVLAFMLFHIGLGLTLTLGIFPLICMLAWVIFLPSETWDWLARRPSSAAIRRVVSSLCSRAQSVAQRCGWHRPSLDTPVRMHRSWLTECLVVALLIYVVLWNTRELDFRRFEDYVLPRRFNAVARATGLDQNWAMFSVPPENDGWLVMKGVLHDGTEVNLWSPGEPLPWEKPARVELEWRSQRWRKYLDNLSHAEYGAHRTYFCDWLVWRWNQEQSGGSHDREVYKVELYHQIEFTPPPGERVYEPETITLATQYY